MNKENTTCLLSGAKAYVQKSINNGAFDLYDLSSFYGNIQYGATRFAEDKIASLEPQGKLRLYYLVKEFRILHNTTPVLSETASKEDGTYTFLKIDDFLETFPKLEDIPFRTLRLYAKLSEMYNRYFSQNIKIPKGIAGNNVYYDGDLFFSKDLNTIRAIISHLSSLGYIDVEESENSIKPRIRPEGIAFVKGQIGESKKAFVAMKFGESPEWTDKDGITHAKCEINNDDIFEKYIAPAIERAGYEATRIDRIYHNKKIDDEILVQIRKAKFLVCDLTYSNLGAYYEAGFAQGLGKEVFFICEKEYFETSGSHFDVNHHVTTLYKKGEEKDFIRELAARIENNVVKI